VTERPATGGPIVEDGVVAGNVYDKYGTRNPIARRLMRGFEEAFVELVQSTGAAEVHEVGCGEGNLARLLAGLVPAVRASDFSHQVIREARREVGSSGAAVDFLVADVFTLDPDEHGAELVVCCEVLEHLERPEAALERLAELARPWLLVSVPWEPLWRVLNVARGKYLAAAGNTPGHLNHWTRRGFLRFLERRVEVVEVRTPFPWTMALCRAPSAG